MPNRLTGHIYLYDLLKWKKKIKEERERKRPENNAKRRQHRKKNIIEYVFVLRVGGGPFRKNKNAKPCEITFGFPCNIESQTGIL